MEQVLIAKEKEISLERLNAKLRNRLNDLLDDAGAEDILQITEAIAKLNSSYKGNSQFGILSLMRRDKNKNKKNY